MEERDAALEQPAAQALLGYLNFSDGRPDPRWQRQLDDAYARFARAGSVRPWESLFSALKAGLHQLRAAGSSAFRDISQADSVINSEKLMLSGTAQSRINNQSLLFTRSVSHGQLRCRR